MIVRVEADDLVPGMHLVAFEGPWLKHPFWRRQFILTAKDIGTIQRSGVTAVVIDDDRGVSATTASAQTNGASLQVVDPSLAAVNADTRNPTDTARAEVDRARRTVAKSKRLVTDMFREARLGRAVQVEALAPLVDEIAESITRDARAMIKVTRLKKKDEYTYLHSVAVCALMINLGRHLGVPETEIHDIGMAGLLHDIGKMAVPEAILNKQGSLDDGEFELIRGHPQAGHALLAGTKNVSKIALDICVHHHERMDGTGYPFGRKGSEISLYSRMAAICDVYDAVTSCRPYKAAWSPTDALTHMLGWQGHFDPFVLQAFIRSIGIYPLGALVALRTSRLAIVIAGNDRDPTLPKVRAFYSTRESELQRFTDFSVTKGWNGDNIVSIEAGERYFGSDWPALLQTIQTNDFNSAKKIIWPERSMSDGVKRFEFG